MADIVVLYRSEDRESIRPLIDWLKENAWSYWWDHDLATGRWNAEVERQIRCARCVLPVWTRLSVAEDAQVPNEVHFALQHQKPRIHVRLEDVPLPVHVSLETYTDLRLDQPATGFRELEGRLRTTLGSGQLGRPPSLVVGAKEYPLPAFVRSVSSYETPLASPADAVLALSLHPSRAPILVSAFDLSNQTSPKTDGLRLHRELKVLDNRGCIIFLDSGNYEAYRLNRGVGQKRITENVNVWLPEHHATVLRRKKPADVILSFDDPMQWGSVDSLIPKIVDSCQRAAMEGRTVVPIVHAPLVDNNERDLDALLEMVSEVSQALDCDTIAVPERELGDGMGSRIRAVRHLRKTLNDTGRYRLLHLLGTGNPYSMLMLATAGADLFDGLEWCRTVADPETGRLHHAHHFDLFMESMKFSESDAVREVHESDDHPFTMKLLVHNLDFFERWMTELRDRIAREDSTGMLRDYLMTSSADDALQVFEAALSEDL